jgi:hypothetical protein
MCLLNSRRVVIRTGTNVTTAAGKAVKATVQNPSFELDCTQGVRLVEDPSMRFQLQVEIKGRTKQEFAVGITIGTDEVCGMWPTF